MVVPAGEGTPLPPLAVVAGGLNSRLGSLRGALYKAFLPIEGSSLVARHVLRASMFGITDVSVITDEDDPLARAVVVALADDLRTTGCAVAHAIFPGSVERKIRGFAAARHGWSRLLVVLGDTIAGIDLHALFAAAGQPGTDSALGVAPFRLPFGVVELTPDGGRVADFEEKPALDLHVNTGYMCLGPAAIAQLEARDLAAVLGGLAREGQLAAVVSSTAIASFDSVVDVARGIAGRLDDHGPAGE
jgi:NDP-sugar pyrophosphorylase family protein